MDWGRPLTSPPPGEPQRRYVYDADHPWSDDALSARPGGFPTSSFLAPYPTGGASSLKLEAPSSIQDMAVAGIPQHPSLGDFHMFPSSGTSSDYISSGGYASRSSQSGQMVPTLSSYFNGSHGPPAGDYFGEVGLHGFSSSDQDAFPVPPQLTVASTASILDENAGDFGEMPTDVNTLMSTQHLSQMMATPPSTVAIARPSALSPVGLLPGRARLTPEVCFGSATASLSQQQQQQQQQQPQYLYSAIDGLEIAADPKFSPDRRKLCCIEGCKSQARAFNRCKRHGGSKRCAHAGCTKSVQSRGLCIRHGGGSRCQEPGCARAAQSQGRCKMHGGGRPCMVPGCDKKAHLKRLCRKHGGGAKCSVADCDKWAQRQGKCMTHSKATLRALSSGSSGASPDLEAPVSVPVPAVVAATSELGHGDSSPDDSSFEHVHV